MAERYKFTDGAFVPNDTYASNAATFQILTGVRARSFTKRALLSAKISGCSAQHVGQDDFPQANCDAGHHGTGML
jgi:hypothetical protein